MNYFEPRVMRRHANGEETFAIYEVYFGQDHGILAHTEDALSMFAKSVDDLRRQLEAAISSDSREVALGEQGFHYSKETLDWWLENLDLAVLEYGGSDAGATIDEL